MRPLTPILLFALAAAPALQAQTQAQQLPTCSPELAAQVAQLQAAVALLSAQVAELRAGRGEPGAAPLAALPAAAAAPIPTAAPDQSRQLDPLQGTTLNVLLDAYYSYNFNTPATQVDQLRPYAFDSNSFSINQATVILEHAPDPSNGQRVGGRVDLQFGQATETLQGNAANELNPATWRNVFQAYGTFVAPLGSGLQLDFGKFASSLGVEGNYSKDQINYSRAFFFDFLPFYHTGLRASYTVSPRLTASYWLVNGAQQTDDFNGFKSQAFLFTLHPAKAISWNVNYYFGQESRSQQASTSTPTGQPILPTPNGREHIFDTYATWTPTPALTLVGEADYVLNRTYSHGTPQHVAGGAAYARYQLPRSYALAARAEYLADPNGLFSGSGQALKELTATFERKLGDSLLLRTEFRRDWTNQPFFQTRNPLLLNRAQPTATLGLIWWWGAKQGSW